MSRGRQLISRATPDASGGARASARRCSQFVSRDHPEIVLPRLVMPILLIVRASSRNL